MVALHRAVRWQTPGLDPPDHQVLMLNGTRCRMHESPFASDEQRAMTLIQRLPSSRRGGFVRQTMPLGKVCQVWQEHIGSIRPRNHRQQMQLGTRRTHYHGSLAALQRAVTALAVPLGCRRRGKLGKFLGGQKLMTSRAGFLACRRLHQPQPAAEMQRHCHEQGEHNLEDVRGHGEGWLTNL